MSNTFSNTCKTRVNLCTGVKWHDFVVFYDGLLAEMQNVKTTTSRTSKKSQLKTRDFKASIELYKLTVDFVSFVHS